MIYLNTLDLSGCPVIISRLSNNASLYSSTAFPFAPFISQQSVLLFLITKYFCTSPPGSAEHMCLGGVTL